ncbi:MAG: ABC transporter substrate-binding protein [Trueperaceae bacterium]
MMRRTLAFVTAGLVLLGSGFAAAQTLVYGQSGFPTTLDSVDSQDGNSLTVSVNITERLIGFERGGTGLAPALATSWSANDDATVWTLELREGVAFHDGTLFDAEAVKFNLDRWNDESHPHGYRDEGKTFVPWTWVFGGFKGDGSILEEVRVVDDHTVELVMAEPVGLLPSMLAAIYFQIDSPTAVMEAGGAYGMPGTGSVGTGPFAFVEWREGERLVVERNSDYWGDVAQVEQVIFRGIEDPTARLTELLAGSIDIAVNMAADDLAIIEESADLEPVVAEAELNVGYLGMHQANEPFDDERVRIAIAHAIDREAIVEAFYGGLGSVAVDFLPPTLWGHADSEPYPYDPERARQLLEEAGHPNGFNTELWYMPVSRPYYPSPQPIAETMASYLADVGIDAELMTEDWTTYLGDYNTGKFPMYMLGWNADYADPDNFLYTFFGPSAPAALGWDDPETIDLLERARQAPTQDERQQLYEQALERVHDQMPSLPVAHTSSVNATRTIVSGFQVSPLGPALPPLNGVSKQE